MADWLGIVRLSSEGLRATGGWGEGGEGVGEQNDEIKLRIEDQMGVGGMRRGIRRCKPRQALEKKRRGKRKRRRKVINNLNKYN